jgi:hypothetical protein
MGIVRGVVNPISLVWLSGAGAKRRRHGGAPGSPFARPRLPFDATVKPRISPSRRCNLRKRGRADAKTDPGRNPAGLVSPIAGKQQPELFRDDRTYSRRQRLFRNDSAYFATTDLAAKFSKGL